MIKAFIFDLDGTLVQTEIMKAHSYALAAIELKPGEIKKHRVIEEYKKLVGRSREEVAKALLHEFNLAGDAEKKLDEFKADEAWQVFVKLRLKYYYEFLGNPRILREIECPYAISLLRKVKASGYRIGLATTSNVDEALKVLTTLGIRSKFDFIATSDLVKKNKPDPEIYNLVFSRLNVLPQECIVIEDSVTGITAALSAETNCISVVNYYTADTVRESGLLEDKWIAYNPADLDGIVGEMLKAKT